VISEARNPIPAPLPNLGSPDKSAAQALAENMRLVRLIVRQTCYDPALQEDALQIACTEFAAGWEASQPGRAERQRIMFAAIRVRRRLRNMHRRARAQKRDVFRTVSGHAELDEGFSIFDTLAAPEPTETFAAEDAALIWEAVATLPKRDRALVEGYWFEGHPAALLAKIYGLTRQRVTQILTAALATLRHRIPQSLAESYAR
jgi:RNA polymerase sigma factor (sigma-70 family)